MKRWFSALHGSALRYGIVGALACVLATLVAEIFVQVMDPPAAAADDALAVALLIDTSGSMTGLPIQEVQSASLRLLRTWERAHTHLALIPFSTSARLLRPVLQLGQDDQPLAEQVESLQAQGGTAVTAALQTAQEVLDEIGVADRAVMLFTDGEPDRPLSTLLKAEALRRAGIIVVAVGTESADHNFLTLMVGNDETRVFTTQLGSFADAFAQAAQAIEASAFGTASAAQGLVVVAVVALLLAASLLIAENAWQLRGRWWRDLWWIPALGLLLGVAGGFLGQNLLRMDLAAWALVGLACGAALGLTDLAGSRAAGAGAWARIPLKSRRGALFGLAGGLAGGTLFSLFFQDAALTAPAGEALALVARIVGFALLGFFIGLAIKIGEELFKDAWIMGTTKGFYEGKRYILSKPLVSVGRSGSHDVNLYREKDIAGDVGHFVRENGAWFFQPAGEAVAVAINGVPVAGKTRLASSATLRFGHIEFEFRRREAPDANAQRKQWALAGDERTFPLPRRKRISVGRDPACDIALDDPAVEPRHCALEFTRQGLCLTPAPGTFVLVNDQALAASVPRPLSQGDLIVIGQSEFGLIATTPER